MKNNIIKALLILLCIAAPVSTEAQTTITGMAGYTNVDNPVGSNVYNIRSEKPINNGNGILNRFTKFNLEAGDIANLFLGNALGVAHTSINVVHDLTGSPTSINGMLRQFAGQTDASSVGGNLIFIDPNGFIIGSQGVINAGSILLSTSSRTYAAFSDSSGLVNLNSTAQDAQLDASVIDINGLYRFSSITGAVKIDGLLNTMFTTPGNNVKQGVNIFANNINIGNSAQITTGSEHVVNLITGKNINYTMNTNNVSAQSALDNSGGITIAGNIKSPDNKVQVWSNSLDLVNNMVNLTGTIDASSLAHNTSGEVTLRSGISQTTAGEIQVNSGKIDSSGNLSVNTTNSVNINGSGSILKANKLLSITGNGMYLNGNYESNEGDIIISNPGSNPLLIDADLTSHTGNINIMSDGPMVLDYSESLLPAGTIPVIDQQTIASDDISIFADNFTSYGSIRSQNGGVVIESNSDTAFVGHCGIDALNNILVIASTILINQPFNTRNGNINVKTNTGNIFLGSNGMLASLNGLINIFRLNESGQLNFTANGIISAENVSTGLNIGNEHSNKTNADPIVLAGNTFGAYSGVYNHSALVAKSDLFSNSMHVNNFAVNIIGTTPQPVNPPAPPVVNPSPVNNNAPNNNPDVFQKNNDNNFDSELDKDMALVSNEPRKNTIDDNAQSGQNSDNNNLVDASAIDDWKTEVYGGIFSDDVAKKFNDQFIDLIEKGKATYNDGKFDFNFEDSYPILKDALNDTDINWVNFFSSKDDTYSFDTRSWDEYSAELKDYLVNKEKQDAWEGEKKAFNDYFDNLNHISELEEMIKKQEQEYDEMSKNYFDSLKAKEAYDKADDEFFDRAYENNQREQEIVKIQLQYVQAQLQKNVTPELEALYQKAMKENQEIMDLREQKIEELDKLKKDYNDIDAPSLNGLIEAKNDIVNKQNELQSLKASTKYYYDQYFKALDRYKKAESNYNEYSKQQQISVNKGGKIAVNGKTQTMDLSPIKYGENGEPLWGEEYKVDGGGEIQSLNPRATLLLRGRTPANPEETGTTVELNIIKDGPASGNTSGQQVPVFSY